MINAYITQEHFDRAFPIEKTGRIMVEAAALDSLKAMAQRLQEERDELLKSLVDCEEALAHLEERMYVRVNPPTLDNARAIISKCTAKPEVLE